MIASMACHSPPPMLSIWSFPSPDEHLSLPMN
jgi:hypothetical protein